MSTLRITNIEAKADPSSPTVDEKIKLTNSNGDILVHIDGKTSGITTIGINTTAGNIKFDQNSNVVVTGIITATKFVGTIEPTTLTVGGDLTIPDKIVHTGDTNTAIRFPAADTVTVETGGSERLRVTSAGDMGLGATPAFSNGSGFEVARSGTACIRIEGNSGNHALEAYADSSGATLDARGSSANLMFDIGGSEKLRIDSSGRLLVGTTSADSNTRLHVSAAENTSDPMATDASIVIANTQNAGNNEAAALKFNLGNTNTASISAHYDAFSAGVNSSLRFYTQYQSGFNSPSERLRILSDGKVAIGGVTANSQLDVHGGDGISITHSGDTFLQSRTTGTTGTNYLEFKDSGGGAGAISYHHNGDSMRFKINGSERARIDSDGHLQIRREGVAGVSGTDSRHTRFIVKQTNNQEAILGSVYAQGKSGWGGDLVFASKSANGNPSSGLTERMRIGDDGKFYYATTSQGPHGGFFNIDASSGGRNGINVKGTTANYVMISSAGGSTGDHIYFSNYSNGNQETGRIKDNSSNVTYYTSSDYRLKDNIVSITDGITRVKQLNPVRHTWINNPALGTVDGWIAHELDEVCPDAVDGEKDAVREDGSIKAQAADYGRITPLLAAALKEAIAKIEALEARVTTLEG